MRARGLLFLIAAAFLGPRAEALTVPEAAHLLMRTGFDASPAGISRLLPLSRDQAVDLLLSETRTDPITPLPSWSPEYLRPPRAVPDDPAATKAARDAYDAAIRWRDRELRDWWYGEMLSTDSPLTERMVLFWHGHFTSALDKVNVPTLMLDQNLLLRREALGSFASMVHDMARNPAMLIYLDGEANVKAHPNENFGRELMELFTLGEGNYTEQDVREVARAFTGWRVDHATGTAIFDSRRHDDGMKTVLGHTGAWDGDQAIDIILQQPQVAPFIVSELWREFVSPTPDLQTVARLAGPFRNDGYQIRPLLRSLLLTNAFWEPAEWGTLVKSPVVLAVGTARVLGVNASAAARVASVVPPMGEQLFNPPTVKGWPSGDAWITSATLVARERALRQVPEPLLRAAAQRLEAGVQDLQARHALSSGQGMETILLPVPVVRSGGPATMASGTDAALSSLRAILLNLLYELM